MVRFKARRGFGQWLVVTFLDGVFEGAAALPNKRAALRAARKANTITGGGMDEGLEFDVIEALPMNEEEFVESVRAEFVDEENGD